MGLLQASRCKATGRAIMEKRELPELPDVTLLQCTGDMRRVQTGESGRQNRRATYNRNFALAGDNRKTVNT